MVKYFLELELNDLLNVSIIVLLDYHSYQSPAVKLFHEKQIGPLSSIFDLYADLHSILPCVPTTCLQDYTPSKTSRLLPSVSGHIPSPVSYKTFSKSLGNYFLFKIRIH